jgi:DHA1 family tetracycline resistance protein-like MFS transporter
MYAITVIYSMGGIAGPALQGIMSNTVPQNEQGELQGGFTSIASLSAIVGPYLMNSVLFATFTRAETGVYFPGAAMLCGGLLSLISAVLARAVLKKQARASNK